MTRINLVPVAELTRQHLVAEYRELPRVFALAWKASLRPPEKSLWRKGQPIEYTLGKGHVVFFYDKLLFLAKRQEDLVAEMIKRGYRPNYTVSLRERWEPDIPPEYWRDYTPTTEALRINRERIDKRLSGDKT